jgi:hypothetical protein
MQALKTERAECDRSDSRVQHKRAEGSPLVRTTVALTQQVLIQTSTKHTNDMRTLMSYLVTRTDRLPRSCFA